MAKTTKKKTTHYTRLVKTKAKLCAGKATKADVKKAAGAYVQDAINKALKKLPDGSKGQSARNKAKREATKKANAVLKRGCSTSSYVAGKKKAAPKKRKTTATRRKTTARRKRSSL